MLAKDRYEEIKEEIFDFFVCYGLKKFPLDVFTIAACLMEIELHPYSEGNDHEQVLFLKQSRDGFSAFVPERKCFAIYYNDSLPLVRQRFTIAHEIGHIYLGHINKDDPACEEEANFFARNLLAPEAVLISENIDDLKAVTRRFGVSSSCAGVILEKLGTRFDWHGHSLSDSERAFLRYLKKGDG